VGKVKKSGEVTDVRRTSKRRDAEGKPTKAARPTKSRRKTKMAAHGARGRKKQASGRTVSRKSPAEQQVSIYRVRELDPHDKCGPGTTVQQLYRVDESNNGASRVHLVFFDRHGWYCEHNRDCPAVIHAKRIGSKRKPMDGVNNARTRA
jgi:hypothetical protein